MSRCVIVGGAPIKDYEIIKSYLREDDYVIYCDSGLYHEEGLGVAPSLIVGDFDSHQKPTCDIETVVLPCEKDDTDTVFAAKRGLEQGLREFLLIGVVGARLDHTLANVYLLEYLENNGATAVIADDYSEMELLGNTPKTVADSYPFFSLISICGKAEGVYIQNAKYPLENAVITTHYQYGVSNEPLKGGAKAWVTNGKALLIKIR